MKDDCLTDRIRAEDIILGALGFDCAARIATITTTNVGFKGIGYWSDGEQFEFESEEEPSELELWALRILLKEINNEQ